MRDWGLSFRNRPSPWVRAPPGKFHERSLFSFPTFSPLSLSLVACQPAEHFGIELTFPSSQAQTQVILGYQTWQSLSGNFPSIQPLFPILFESNNSDLRRAASSMRKRPSSVILNTATHPCRPSPPTGREGAFLPLVPWHPKQCVSSLRNRLGGAGLRRDHRGFSCRLEEPRKHTG